MTRLFVGTTRWRRDGRPGVEGLYRSDDGAAWTPCAGLSGGGVGAMLVMDGGRTILAGAADGVHASRDGGKRWGRCGSGTQGHRIWSLLARPADPALLFAGAGPCAILRSADGGRTWHQADIRRSGEIFSVADDGTPLPFAARVTSIAADPTPGSRRLYAALEVEGVLRSDDDGLSWIDSSTDLLALADAPHLQDKIGAMDGRKSMADGHCIRVLPGSGDVLYANRLGLFRSRDHGDSWQDVRLDRFSPLTYVRQFQCLDGTAGDIIACLSAKASGTDGSLWRSGDAGGSWRRLDHGLSHDSTLMTLAADPADPAHICAASYSGAVYRTEDGGRTWRTSRLPGNSAEAYTIAYV